MKTNRVLLALFALWIVPALVAPANAEPWPYYPWDETHGLGNHFGTYQNYGGGAYYHDGIDLVTPGGPVSTYSVSDGTITHLTYNQPLYSGIMIGEPIAGGEGWLYWHINSTTFQFDIGDEVMTNDYIGDTAYWPVAAFHHVHFNEVQGTSGYPWGWYLAIGNPLESMVPNHDPDEPEFEITYADEIFAFRRNGSSTILDHTALTGEVDIVSRIVDIVGLPQWGLNPWKIDYWIEGATQSVPVTNSVTFTGQIPNSGTEGVIYSMTTPLRTQGDYNYRIFYFIVTNTDGDGWVESGDAAYNWNTDLFDPGDYWAYVRAGDVGGNSVTESMLCTIAGAVNPDIAVSDTHHDFGFVGVGDTSYWTLLVFNEGTDPLSVREITSSNLVFSTDLSHFFVLPGEYGEVEVSFTPFGMQPYAGTLEIGSNDPDEPLIYVNLEGTGADPAAAEEPVASALGLRGLRSLPGGIEASYALQRAGSVNFEVFEISGRRVHTSGEIGMAAGPHTWTWDGITERGERAASGVYLVRFSGAGQTDTRSAVLIR